MGAVHIPIIDEDALDDLVTAVQALAAPSGTNVAISNTGMHYVTASNAQGAISELDAEAYALNASLSKLDYYTLLSGDIVSSTKTTKTLYGGRKLSDYRMFFAVIRINSINKASMFVPKSLFQSASDQFSLFYVDSSNVQRWFEITYKNDTQVDIQASSNVASSTAVYLFGYKDISA